MVLADSADALALVVAFRTVRSATHAGTERVIWPVVTDDETACMDCDRVLPFGSPYSKRLVAMSDKHGPVMELICVYCSIGPVVFADELPLTGMP